MKIQIFGMGCARKIRYTLTCIKCNTTFDEKETVSHCLRCGGPLDVRYPDPKPLPRLKNLRNNKNRMFGFDDSFDFLEKMSLLPFKGENRVSLGEGNTPLIHAENIGKSLGMPNLYLKVEGANPTGAFKDRGSSVEITKALEMGGKAVVCASTGNMAASVAAYCAKAEIPCYVIIPEKTPMGKLAQSIAYGAKVIRVRGDYDDCVRLSVQMSKRYRYYLAGDYAFRLEGQKTTAYEIMRQLNIHDGPLLTPDWVVVPVGCGTNLSAIYKGFKELMALGLIGKMPRFVCAQPEKVPTIAEAWRQRLDHYFPVKHISTIAFAVGIGVPLDDKKVLKALYESHGYAETSSEEDILGAQLNLGKREALFVEPSGALPIAVLPKLLEKHIIRPEETVVGILTGNGLKDPRSILSSDVDSPVIDPAMDEIERCFPVKNEIINNT